MLTVADQIKILQQMNPQEVIALCLWTEKDVLSMCESENVYMSPTDVNELLSSLDTCKQDNTINYEDIRLGVQQYYNDTHIIGYLKEAHGDGLSCEGAHTISMWCEQQGRPVKTLEDARNVVVHLREYSKLERNRMNLVDLKDFNIPLSNDRVIIGKFN